MKSHFRFFAALFALIAFTAFLAEGLWASTCYTEMGSGAFTTSSMEGEAPSGACAAGMIMPSTDESGDTDGSHSGVPHCPLIPVGATGSCTGVVSLPAGPLDDLAPSPEGALLSLAPDQARDLLLVAAFFHPPRA